MTSLDRFDHADAADSGGLLETTRLAVPLVASTLLTTAMGVADAAIVGRLGATELAAVGLAGMWAWALSSFFVGATTAIQTFVAQSHGAGTPTACGAWSWQGLASTLPLATLASGALFVGADAFVSVLAPSDAVAPLASSYLLWRAIGIPGLTIAVALSAFFRGVGDARTPLVATVVANALNLYLDFALVYGWFGFPALGVAGAGLATAVAEWVYAATVVIAFFLPAVRRRFATTPVRPNLSEIRRLWRVGLPIGGQWVTEMLAFALFTTMIARMGDAQTAASHAFIQLMSLAFMQAEGISLATSTLVGRYIGADRIEIAERCYRSGLVLGASVAATISALMLGMPETMIGLFSTDPAVREYAGALALIGAAYVFFDTSAIVSDGALRGAGDTTWPFVVRSALAWVVMLPIAGFLAFTVGWGLEGAWLGSLVAMGMLATALFVRFRSGTWRTIRI